MSTSSVTTQQRRNNREIYYKEQHYTTEKYVVPYINSQRKILKKDRVLEIGCGEGGNLKYFVDLGCDVVGLDIGKGKIDLAIELSNRLCDSTENLTLIQKDIYDTTVDELGKFNIIMMRDVIEHIPNQKQFLAFLKQFITDDGIVYFGFPPWQMPFGGHQQGCKSILSKTPYFHILPNPIYKGILKIFGEPERRIASLLQTKSTGISIEQFKSYSKQAGWDILDESPFLFNPNYEAKFNLKPRKQFGLINAIPYFRNYLTTCAYFLIAPAKS